MTVRQLHLLGSPVLRQRSTPVATVDDAVRRLVDDLFETMHAAKGVGLAANQVGIARRVAVVDVGEDGPPPLGLINPRIAQASCADHTSPAQLWHAFGSSGSTTGHGIRRMGSAMAHAVRRRGDAPAAGICRHGLSTIALSLANR